LKSFLVSLFSVSLSLAAALAAQDAEPALFKLETADGVVRQGPLVELHDDRSLALGGPEAVRVAGGEVLSLRRLHSRLPARPPAEHVVLTCGDVIAGTPVGLKAEQLLFQARFSSRASQEEAELSLPTSAVALVWLAAPTTGNPADLFERRLLGERRRHDQLWLRNGDVVEGVFAGIDAQAADFRQEQGKPSRLERDRVAAIALSTELALKPRSRGPYIRLVLANGSRLSLASAHLDGPHLTGSSLFGTELRLPLAEIVALDVHQGRAVYLSDLKPRRFEETPYFSTRWGYRNDASVAGRDLQLDGSHYDKGIGMHSGGRLTYDLAGRYQRFESWVGLDERTGRSGNVTLQVVVDGKVQDLGWNGEQDGRDRARRVRVSVAGARELTLVVDFGRRGDIQDHLDWAGARLIQAR
jgi:hypothetical protein